MELEHVREVIINEGYVKKILKGDVVLWQKETWPQETWPKGPFTAAQSAAIRAGNFTDVPVEFSWIFSNVPYTYLDENNITQSDTYSGTMRVADHDYYLNTGDTPLTTHHVVVVPDDNMFHASMNTTNTTAGGYVGSKMRTTHLIRAEAIFKACFGENHVLKHREYLVYRVSSSAEVGKAEVAGAWYNSTVELMDERMVFGSAKYANTSLPSVSNKQLSLFKNNSDRIKNGKWYWLRNVPTVALWAGVSTTGAQGDLNSCYSYGVRPYALIY